jgi:hypothetical protein
MQKKQRREKRAGEREERKKGPENECARTVDL